MKRCPECRRDYYDDTLSFCLADGAELVYGVADDEPATAILSEPGAPSGVGTGFRSGEDQTRQQINTADQTAIFPHGAAAEPQKSLDDLTEKRSFSARRGAKPLLAVVALAVILSGAFFGYRYLNSSSDRTIRSIAVLPFANASGDKDTDFLSDGIAETLINSFTKIPELKVTARTTAFRFRGREGEPKEIGRELGVGTVLTGTVFQQNDNVRVQVDLIDTADGSQLWGNRYDGKAAEIIDIQQRIAADVASRLKLSTEQTQQIARTYTQNADAYQHYLRGRHHWNKRTPDGIKSALGEFQLAIEKDPTYALAYSGLADSYLLMEEYADVPILELLPKASSAAEQAIRLDDSLAEAHTSMASVNDASWQWEAGRREYQRAIELNPNYPTAHHWYSIHLRNTGKFDESLVEAKRAHELDPLSSIIASNLVGSYLAAGDIEGAEAQARRALQLDPNFTNINYMFGAVRLKQGHHDEAVAAFQKAVDVSGRSSGALGSLGFGLAVAGKRTEAIAILRELESRFERGESVGVNIAMILVGLGEKDAAFGYLDKVRSAQSSRLAQIVWMEPFIPLRGDPRFQTLLRQMNISIDNR